MTQLGLNIFCICKFLNFFGIFEILENRKMNCGKINDRNLNDRKIKIEISNLII